MEPGEAVLDAIRGHLALVGPATVAELAGRTGIPAEAVLGALVRLEADGIALRGRFDPGRPAEDGQAPLEFCDRRLLARIHRYTTARLRQEIEPVTAQDFLRFLFRWQHVAPGTQLEGRRGVLAAVDQLQGFEIAAGSWERAVLPLRVAGYQAAWLDDLCLSGEVAWARLAPRAAAERPGRSARPPSAATPVSLLIRDNLAWLLRAARGAASAPLPAPGPARDVLARLTERGALFFDELVNLTGRVGAEVTEALWDLVGRGLVTADGFGSVRALGSARDRWARRAARPAPPDRLRRAARGQGGGEGRWFLLPGAPDGGHTPGRAGQDGWGEPELLAEAVAEQLLARWGVVFRDVVARETLALPWREIVWALRRLEARGTVRGGRFVTGFAGEQFALPEAVEGLRQTRRRARDGEIVRVAAVDPLNLVGILTPGVRVPAARGPIVAYRDGAPLAGEGSLPRSTVAGR